MRKIKIQKSMAECKKGIDRGEFFKRREKNIYYIYFVQ